MKKAQSGFTLVEMVMVVIVVGTLSAVAVPKYVDYKEGAGAAAVKGIAASLGSAAANNYSAVVALMPNAVKQTLCTDLPALLTGGLPEGMVVEAYSATASAATAATLATVATATTAATAATAATPAVAGAFGDGTPATTGSAPSGQGVAPTISPAVQGTCKVYNPTKFKAWMTFPYTPINLPG